MTTKAADMATVEYTKQFVLRWDAETFDNVHYLMNPVAKMLGVPAPATKADVFKHAVKLLADHVRELRRIEREKKAARKAVREGKGE